MEGILILSQQTVFIYIGLKDSGQQNFNFRIRNERSIKWSEVRKSAILRHFTENLMSRLTYKLNEYSCMISNCEQIEKGRKSIGDPFVYLLKKHGIIFNRDPEAESDGIIKIPPKAKSKGQSKLKKWSCGCTNIRVAVKDFKAKCLNCGNDFVRDY